MLRQILPKKMGRPPKNKAAKKTHTVIVRLDDVVYAALQRIRSRRPDLSLTAIFEDMTLVCDKQMQEGRILPPADVNRLLARPIAEKTEEEEKAEAALGTL